MEGLAVGFLFDFVGPVERGFYGAELLDELDRAFVADAGGAGDVVDCIAAQSHDVDDLLRWDAEVGFDAGWVEDEVVFRRVENADAVIDELHHVLVGADDVDVVAERG